MVVGWTIRVHHIGKALQETCWWGEEVECSLLRKDKYTE
jgi:hypothetical protein